MSEAAAVLGAAIYVPVHEARVHPIIFDQSLPDHRFDESCPLKRGKP